MSKNWTRDEVVLALFLYCQIPFGRCTQRRPEVVELARIIGRTPGAVAFKLGNLGHFDPKLRARGVSGLANASKLDELVWNEFHGNWQGLLATATGLLQEKREAVWEPECELFEVPDSITTEQEAQAVQRRGQDFFRRAVLSSYNSRCCITGMSVPQVLRASHILDWAGHPEQRLDPQNGLCLAATQDAAFDRRLITLDEDYCLIVTPAIHDFLPNDAVETEFIRFAGKQIHLPERFLPRQEYLEEHRAEALA